MRVIRILYRIIGNLDRFHVTQRFVLNRFAAANVRCLFVIAANPLFIALIASSKNSAFVFFIVKVTKINRTFCVFSISSVIFDTCAKSFRERRQLQIGHTLTWQSSPASSGAALAHPARSTTPRHNAQNHRVWTVLSSDHRTRAPAASPLAAACFPAYAPPMAVHDRSQTYLRAPRPCP